MVEESPLPPGPRLMGAGRFGAWLILQNGVARRFLSRRFENAARTPCASPDAASCPSRRCARPC